MRIIVCGGRDYTDQARVDHVLDTLHAKAGVELLIHGAARGADTLAANWARKRGVQALSCPADWDRHGKRAGVLRNVAMLQLRPKLVVALPGGRGTAHMVSIARQAGVMVVEVPSQEKKEEDAR